MATRETFDKGVPFRSTEISESLWRCKDPVWARKPQARGNKMLPGITSTDPEWFEYLRGLSNDLNDKLRFEPSEDGLAGSNGVTGTFDALRTISGIPMRPLTYLPADNTNLCKDMGLPPGFMKESHRAIWTKVHECMFSKYQPTNLRVPKGSTSGFPFFERDDERKLAMARYIIANLDDILKMLESDDLEGLSRKHGFVISYFMNTRGQADPPGKERFVNDFLYAKTGGRKGRRFVADKSIPDGHGGTIGDLSAQRMRTVCGLSMCANIIINMFQYGMRKHYQHSYAFIWHHTGREDFLAKISRYEHTVNLDVTQFDQSCQTWMLDFFMAEMSKYIDPRVLRLYQLAHHAPYFQPSVDGVQPGRWLGDPLNIDDFKLNAGLMSGVGTVSDLGKYLMTSAYLCAIDDVTGDVLDFGVERVLRGEHPRYALLDMGDDAVLLTNDLTLRQRFLEIARTEGACYFKFDIEEAGSFVGNVPIWTQSHKLEVVPDISSYFIKFLVAERGIDSVFRRFWYIGYYERKMLFAAAPAYEEAEALSQYHFKRCWPEVGSMNSLVDRFVNSTSAIMPEASSYSDLQVLLDPNKIHYQFDPDEISQTVMAAISCSIPYEEFERHVRRYYTGTIL